MTLYKCYTLVHETGLFRVDLFPVLDIFIYVYIINIFSIPETNRCVDRRQYNTFFLKVIKIVKDITKNKKVRINVCRLVCKLKAHLLKFSLFSRLVRSSAFSALWMTYKKSGQILALMHFNKILACLTCYISILTPWVVREHK